jgi:hypothetical protein
LEDAIAAKAPILTCLRDHGFSGEVKEGIIDGDSSGVVKTISMSDFRSLLLWNALVNDSSYSIILLAAFAEVGLERIMGG